MIEQNMDNAPPKKTANSDKWEAAWSSWDWTTTNQVFPDWTKKGQCAPKKTSISDKWEVFLPSWDWITTNQWKDLIILVKCISNGANVALQSPASKTCVSKVNKNIDQLISFPWIFGGIITLISGWLLHLDQLWQNVYSSIVTTTKANSTLQSFQNLHFWKNCQSKLINFQSFLPQTIVLLIRCLYCLAL